MNGLYVLRLAWMQSKGHQPMLMAYEGSGLRVTVRAGPHGAELAAASVNDGQLDDSFCEKLLEQVAKHLSRAPSKDPDEQRGRTMAMVFCINGMAEATKE